MQFIAKFRKYSYSKHSFKVELNAKRGLRSSLIIHACDNVLQTTKFYRMNGEYEVLVWEIYESKVLYTAELSEAFPKLPSSPSSHKSKREE